MSSYEKINKTYKSRKNLLNILKKIGYDTSNYDGFDENEISTLLEVDQLDMILHKNENKDNKSKIYVKYDINTSKINCDQNFLSKISDFFESNDDKNTTILNKNDTLIIIIDAEMTDRIKECLKNIYENYGYFVVVHNIIRLQYNILEHSLNPKYIHILDEDEIEEFKKKYFIDDLTKIPEISRFDPYALSICLRPGQICKVEYSSVNALNHQHYVYCI